MRKQGKCRPGNYRTIRKSLQDGKRKWSKTTQNTPKTSDDTNGTMEKNQKQREQINGNNRRTTKLRRIGKEKWGKYMTTWTSPDGNIRRHIDYITTNAKHRNMAKTAQSNIYWHGNMNQNQQHRVQTMQHYYNAAEKYKKHIPAATGTRLKYDIKELRLRPKKLTKSFQELQQETIEQQEIRHDWEDWEGYQKTLGGLLEKHIQSAKRRQCQKSQTGH